MPMKIKMTPVAQLVPYAANARTHSQQQIAQIAASITEFGFTNPILSGADNIIIAGHGRLSDAPALATGDPIDIDGISYTVQGEPLRDRERLIWTVELVPA